MLPTSVACSPHIINTKYEDIDVCDKNNLRRLVQINYNSDNSERSHNKGIVEEEILRADGIVKNQDKSR